ncbi:MAG: S8 family serine peptidase, partial [Candidatus Krumholzibacteria bacterium]|nr:S8 family serine peptidase [Candidatus Krumholzibacteria bacterium]
MKIVRILLASLLIIVFVASCLSADTSKLNTPLKFLKSARETGIARAKADRAYLAAALSNDVTVTMKFDHVLTGAEITSLARLGVSFFSIDGEVAHTGPFYAANVPWDAVEELSAREDVLKLDSAWKPCVFPCLDVSAHDIEADSAWLQTDPLGLPLTGTGMRIADFDTGIDVFHPSFFYADGDTFDWIDTNLDAVFTASTDRVDLDRDGIADLNERLSYLDGWIYDPALVWSSANPSNNGNGYQTYWDWLYNDANFNYRRDYGTASGYTESSPTFGEQIFIAIDSDDDGALDVGEKLVALKTSKVYATLTTGAVEYLRGTDLINNENDSNGHGTAVAGILAGGTVDRHIFTGIAPDAEILEGYFFSDNPISALIPWALSRGADVMLYEFGGFVWDYLDGSSTDEELI